MQWYLILELLQLDVLPLFALFSYSSAVENYGESARDRPGFAEFSRDILHMVDEYLAELRRKARYGEPVLRDRPEKVHENRLTYEIVNLAKVWPFWSKFI